jgi:hypothetical protein
MYRAPFSKILPSFAPVILERGLPGYALADLQIPGERRLTPSELRSLLIGSAFIGIEALAIEQQFDRERFIPILAHSVRTLQELTPPEQERSLELVQAFKEFRIIRSDHAFEDWICEALWELHQTAAYAFPSAMSDAVAYGLTIIQSLQKCTLEYD